jgi:hypothetical protein
MPAAAAGAGACFIIAGIPTFLQMARGVPVGAEDTETARSSCNYG